MYPIALDLRERLVVVVGAGAVAERKVAGLLAATARVRVIAPDVAPALRDAARGGAIELRERAFVPDDLDGATLAYAATGNREVDAAVVAAARARRVLVDDVSGGGPSDFATPLVHRSGPLTFAVDTGGTSPSFGKRLLAELRETYDARYARAAETLGRARAYVKTVVPAPYRAAVMDDLARRPVETLLAMNPNMVEDEVERTYAGLTAARDAEGAEAAPAPLVCATRASDLAMWQTRLVMATLAQAGIASTVLQISTKGDRVQDRSLAALGTDSIFVKELERALRDGRADYAVHSCKDLPSTLPDDMRLAAIGARADARDAFCSERYPAFDALPSGAVVGTSSPRRRALLQAQRPDLRFETIRGNVDTRLRKLRDGDFDAIVLAMAGLGRLELRARHTVPLSAATIVPAVGQGALAIEVRAADAGLAERIHALFADRATEIAVCAERAFLRTLRGGCQAPVGAHATFMDGELTMRAAIAASDGSHVVRGEITALVGSAADAEIHGEALAHRLLGEGGAALLARATGDDGDEPPAGTLAGRLFLLPRTQDRPSRIAPALRGEGAEVVEVSGTDDAALALGERTPDVLLFPSSGSVHAIATYLAALHERGARPVVAAMGDASSAAARDAGFPPDVIATEAGIGAFVQSVTHYMIASAAGPAPR